MTIRDHLRRKKARYLVIGALCLVATFSLITTHGITRQADYSHAAMALLLGYLACILLSQGIACPRCRGDGGWLHELVQPAPGPQAPAHELLRALRGEFR